MIGVKVKPKKWGNSIAVIIPERIAKRAKIEVGKPLEFFIPERVDLRILWGTLKTKRTAQQLKDEARSGWN